MEMDKEMYERRATPPPKGECTKLDTFQSISNSLDRIENKVDDLADEMKMMIKLEQQVLTQSKDIERISVVVDSLRAENKDLSNRLLELRSNFESQKQTIGNFERIIWAAATVIAILVGKYVFGIG
jgi:chromosome segregation ATPase